MLQTLLASVLLLTMFSSATAAPVYRCRTATGTLVFTDNPSLFPPGCRELPGSGDPDASEEPAAATTPGQSGERLASPEAPAGETPPGTNESPPAPGR